MKKLIVLSLGLILVAAACNKNTDQANNTTPPPAATPPAANPPTPLTPTTPLPNTGATVITYTSSGFSPGSITVKKGTKVIFVNNSGSAFHPASAPHPSHTDYPAFDPKKAISAGASWEFTFDKVGTWKYHDHLNPTKFGSVTVTD